MITKKAERASEYLEREFGPLYFSDLLKSYRLGEEITQEALAKKLKTTKQKICDYEKGRRIPSMETVVKWAKKLKEPYDIWTKAYLQQQIDEANIDLLIEVKRA